MTSEGNSPRPRGQQTKLVAVLDAACQSIGFFIMPKDWDKPKGYVFTRKGENGKVFAFMVREFGPRKIITPEGRIEDFEFLTVGGIIGGRKESK